MNREPMSQQERKDQFVALILAATDSKVTALLPPVLARLLLPQVRTVLAMVKVEEIDRITVDAYKMAVHVVGKLRELLPPDAEIDFSEFDSSAGEPRVPLRDDGIGQVGTSEGATTAS